MTRKHDWYWACASSTSENPDTPAGRRFLIANGEENLWRRVRAEIDRNEDCAWNTVHPRQAEPGLDDILDMMLTVVQPYGVHLSTFSIEAAQIPVFARFLRGARSALCNYVSNAAGNPSERYDRKEHIALGRSVNRTLGIDDEEWWEL